MSHILCWTMMQSENRIFSCISLVCFTQCLISYVSVIDLAWIETISKYLWVWILPFPWSWSRVSFAKFSFSNLFWFLCFLYSKPVALKGREILGKVTGEEVEEVLTINTFDGCHLGFQILYKHLLKLHDTLYQINLLSVT